MQGGFGAISKLEFVPERRLPAAAGNSTARTLPEVPSRRIFQGTNEVKNEKAPKAKRIAVGVDAHPRGYQVGRKIDKAARRKNNNPFRNRLQLS
jgi:hypothetical protein